jgi:hypothetical protein
VPALSQLCRLAATVVRLAFGFLLRRSRSSRRGWRPFAAMYLNVTLRCGVPARESPKPALAGRFPHDTEKVSPAASLTSKWNYATLARDIIYDPL